MVFAQLDEPPFKMFGYFQTGLEHQIERENLTTPSAALKLRHKSNSFNVQQLNLFLQRDLSIKWRAFISFEVLNSFSSLRNWGAFNVEEAWIKYRADETFSLKLGLLVPTFNNFNEIKNRTPLLPYIIRPIAYETSFGEDVAVEDYTPARAFAQAYGYLRLNEIKWDYSIYVGNSPNMNRDPGRGQTGIDTTNTFLVGARFGLRWQGVKAGVSFTRDNDSELTQFYTGPDGPYPDPRPEAPDRLREIPRTRLGADLSYNQGHMMFETEYITLKFGNQSEIDLERNFYYATLGYRLTEEFLTYLSYWLIDDVLEVDEQDDQRLKVNIFTVGCSHQLNERITLKAQYAYARLQGDEVSLQVTDKSLVHFFTVATSVMF